MRKKKSRKVCDWGYGVRKLRGSGVKIGVRIMRMPMERRKMGLNIGKIVERI